MVVWGAASVSFAVGTWSLLHQSRHQWRRPLILSSLVERWSRPFTQQGWLALLHERGWPLHGARSLHVSLPRHVPRTLHIPRPMHAPRYLHVAVSVRALGHPGGVLLSLWPNRRRPHHCPLHWWPRVASHVLWWRVAHHASLCWRHSHVLGAHHASLGMGSLIVLWPHSTGWGTHHASWGSLHSPRRRSRHPSRSRGHARRPVHPLARHPWWSLMPHVPLRAWVPLHALRPMHVLGPHEALWTWGALVVLGSGRAHLSLGNERSLWASGTHRSHVGGHLLRQK